MKVDVRELGNHLIGFGYQPSHDLLHKNKGTLLEIMELQHRVAKRGVNGMEMCKLGNSGLEVTAIGLGCMGTDHDYGKRADSVK